jgi:hypothetical protein
VGLVPKRGCLLTLAYYAFPDDMSLESEGPVSCSHGTPVCNCVLQGAMPWLRSLVAGLSPRRPGFAPGSIHVGFVVDKMALGQVFLRVLRFSPVNIIPPLLSKLISSGECVIC